MLWACGDISLACVTVLGAYIEHDVVEEEDGLKRRGCAQDGGSLGGVVDPVPEVGEEAAHKEGPDEDSDDLCGYTHC